ncbi:hypothetical protein DAI22_07g077200 [Oryza sativa Japonica Group]|nr:hypothetical protein DAI22_07g077200 [Oryza sativa Japonica Group]
MCVSTSCGIYCPHRLCWRVNSLFIGVGVGLHVYCLLYACPCPCLLSLLAPLLYMVTLCISACSSVFLSTTELVVPQSFVVGVLPHGQHVNQHDQQLPRSILALRTSLWSFGGKGNWQSCVAGCLLHQLAMEQHARIRKNVKVLGKTC